MLRLLNNKMAKSKARETLPIQSSRDKVLPSKSSRDEVLLILSSKDEVLPNRSSKDENNRMPNLNSNRLKMVTDKMLLVSRWPNPRTEKDRKAKGKELRISKLNSPALLK